MNWMASHSHGETYDVSRDEARLNAQCERVYRVVKSGEWFTLSQLSLVTGDPEASVSARLRDLRKFGFTVEREYVSRGLHRYRLKP